mmetsp:Transcript_57801/g.163088  ORF Transcript_57801/g.163088 Transcript_57801/m.163088 type:complete len:230 (+) Transcript_57801:319-1008(+)
MYSYSERLHFGGRHLKKTDSASHTATRILSFESSRRFRSSGYTSRSCSLLISACISLRVQVSTRHAIIRLSGDQLSSRQLLRIGTRSAKDAFSVADPSRPRWSMACMHTMPPFRILLFDCPGLQVQLGMRTLRISPGAWARQALVSTGSSSVTRKCASPRMSIRAGIDESSGEDCLASTGTNASTCSAAEAPAFRSKVSRTCRLELRSSQSSASAPKRRSPSRERRCSS